MELTILLSKVFGIYFLVMGLFLVFHRGWFKTVVSSFAEMPALRFMMGLVMLIGGLFLIVSHQDWSSFAAGFISFLGWAVAVKALLYMNLTNNGVRRWTGWFKVGGAYGLVAGLLYIALGLYLTNFGYAWF